MKIQQRQNEEKQRKNVTNVALYFLYSFAFVDYREREREWSCSSANVNAHTEREDNARIKALAKEIIIYILSIKMTCQYYFKLNWILKTDENQEWR